MVKFLIKASYSSEGAKGLIKAGGTIRKQAVEKMINDLGGKVESFYYALGDTDVYVIAEVPDLKTLAAISLTVNSSGLVSLTTTMLINPEDIDNASKMSVSYRTPGS